jgi:LPXTG-site transpeptidase (sortase) family protein
MREYLDKDERETYGNLEQKITFFFVCVGAIALTYGVLYLVDFLPETPTSTTETTESQVEVPADNTEVQTPVLAPVVDEANALPVSIIFDSLDGREVKVFNPKTSDVATLDADLLKGAVRHPDSATFKDTGTMFILAHSSYLPHVINKNFQAFNGIQKLKWGDTIRVRSNDTEYVYSVDRVYEAKASDAEVAIQHDEAKLTLATCNTFATKDDRFVVEASLVSQKPIGE